MASLADELLADLEPGGAEAPPEPVQEDAQGTYSGHPAYHAFESEVGAEAQNEAELGLEHDDATRPPEPMDQETLDTMDFGKTSIDSARSVSKLYGSDTLADVMNVRTLRATDLVHRNLPGATAAGTERRARRHTGIPPDCARKQHGRRGRQRGDDAP